MRNRAERYAGMDEGRISLVAHRPVASGMRVGRAPGDCRGYAEYFIRQDGVQAAQRYADLQRARGVGGSATGRGDRTTGRGGDPGGLVLGASAGQSGGGLEEDLYWRLSDSWYQKDLLPATYLEVHNQCYEAYNANPLANAIIELATNFVLGSGIAVVASEPRTQVAIDGFWCDQDNHTATRVYSLCMELSLYGELFVRFFVNPYSEIGAGVPWACG